MTSIGLVLAVLWIGFLVGALARFVLPGPDPMPIWLTTSIGIAGSIIGAVVAREAHGGNYLNLGVAFAVAVVLVGLYRRLVQRRPIFGPGARRFPDRGIGIEVYRERLRKAGFDPETMQPDTKALREAHLKNAIEELHRAGLLDDEEVETMRERLEHPEADTRVT